MPDFRRLAEKHCSRERPVTPISEPFQKVLSRDARPAGLHPFLVFCDLLIPARSRQMRLSPFSGVSVSPFSPPFLTSAEQTLLDHVGNAALRGRLVILVV